MYSSEAREHMCVNVEDSVKYTSAMIRAGQLLYNINIKKQITHLSECLL